jgi:glycosyltransferase involved in cell wall biosynthesis
MRDAPAVSVVLPTYDRATMLPRAIASVLRQDFADFELIVVDDASRDDTPTVLSALQDARVRVIRLHSNKGQANARNIGIREARAPLLAFQDSDDVWHLNKLRMQVDAIARMPDVSVVYCDMRRIRFDGTWFVLHAPAIEDGEIFDARPSLYSPRSLGIQSCLARRSALLDVGGFDVRRRVWDDLELFLRMIERGHQFRRLPEPLVDYYETVGVSHDRSERRRARVDLLKTYGYRLALRSPTRLIAEFADILRS